MKEWQKEIKKNLGNKNRFDRHKKILEELHNTYTQKNNAYGNSFADTYKDLGIISAVTRITDKYNRLKTLAVNKNIDKGDESIIDTLKDMANYCIMTVIELEEDQKK